MEQTEIASLWSRVCHRFQLMYVFLGESRVVSIEMTMNPSKSDESSIMIITAKSNLIIRIIN